MSLEQATSQLRAAAAGSTRSTVADTIAFRAARIAKVFPDFNPRLLSSLPPAVDRLRVSWLRCRWELRDDGAGFGRDINVRNCNAIGGPLDSAARPAER